ncbi:sialate O-acetylesterase [Lewinella sp. LCG006]|uniref:sialate O-acetylesterase n=1 Tax=Lewinella sp. LCG006 TaxID=3231911 RepID=UPI00346137FF
MKIPRLPLLSLLFILRVFCCSLSAAILLPDVLADNMVLQRQQKVPVWGWASPGESIEVTFHDQIHQTEADTEGKWMIYLRPMSASATPSSLTISGENTITLKNILVGEVWLCTGQSNMQWRLLESAGGEEAIAKANYPDIRLFNVSREVGFKHQEGRLATWELCSPETVPSFSGVGYFFGLDLYRLSGVPVGLINSSYGGSQAEAWTPREFLAASEELAPCIAREDIWAAERPQVQAKYDEDIANWKKAVAKAKAEGSKLPNQPRSPDALRDYRIAGSIYENMIAPLIPYAIRGTIWYQGESNEERAEQYELLLTTMIASWRSKWGQGDFPFGIVQLPNFRATSDVPQDLAWSHLRDRQRKVAEQVPNTGLIVTIDIGEADDIHPTNKYDVGMRLSRWAQQAVYGYDLLAGGPVFSHAKFRKGKAILYFDQVGQGLQTTDSQAPQEFVIAGPDQQWHWANAKIKGRRKIIVDAQKVELPQAVRYAFNNNPVQPNLTNETGVPASPFRTDTWLGPTHGKR